jgi:hypothetical protein
MWQSLKSITKLNRFQGWIIMVDFLDNIVFIRSILGFNEKNINFIVIALMVRVTKLFIIGIWHTCISLMDSVLFLRSIRFFHLSDSFNVGVNQETGMSLILLNFFRSKILIHILFLKSWFVGVSAKLTVTSALYVITGRWW